MNLNEHLECQDEIPLIHTKSCKALGYQKTEMIDQVCRTS